MTLVTFTLIVSAPASGATSAGAAVGADATWPLAAVAPASLSTAQQIAAGNGVAHRSARGPLARFAASPEAWSGRRTVTRTLGVASESDGAANSKVVTLRRYIAAKHQATLQHTTLLGRPAFPTRHRWKTTRSIPYLRYLSALWQMRARASWLLVVDWRESFGGNPNVALGNQLARRYGWHHGAEWDALYRLWNHESGWDHTAHNRQGSGACGIPQSMSGCFGYSPRAQIAWGLSYIRGRYGRPTVALAHFYARNWY